MIGNVHVLATCLNPDLIGNTLLVFDSIRIGFPTANIHVFSNDLAPDIGIKVHAKTFKVGATFNPITNPVTHGQWIERLIEREKYPFWICDTDITFYDRVDHCFDGSHELFSGRYEPEFFEQWTQSIHVARLHPSLMWFNPMALRAAIRAWPGKHTFFASVYKTLIQWAFVPFGDKLLFYDTCAGLHQALGGVPFPKALNDCFTHRFAGTYRHLLGTSETDLKIHEAVCKNWNPTMRIDTAPKQE